MSDEKEQAETSKLTLKDVSAYQSKKIGELLDFNQAVVVVCRRQAESWQELSQAYLQMAEMAADIAASCAIAARISVDRSGDILSSEFDLVTIYPDEEEDDGEYDPADLSE